MEIKIETVVDFEKVKSDRDTISYNCTKCGQPHTRQYRGNKLLLCHKCKLAESHLDRKKILEKRKQTNIEKYGVEFPQKLNAAKEKMKQTKLKKYGNTSGNIEKVQKTCLERYGSISPFGNSAIREKARKNENRQLVGDKISNTWANKSKSEKLDILEKRKQTNIKRFGTEWFSQTKESKDQIKQTCIEKYGVDSIAYVSSIREKRRAKYTYKNINFDSSWELYLYIYFELMNENAIYHPDIGFDFTYNGENHKYFPDFKVDGTFYEVKGDQFIENGVLINPFDRTQDGLYNAKYQCMRDNGVCLLTETDMEKYIDYVDDKYSKNFVPLFKNRIEFPYPNAKLNDNSSDMDVIRHFHKSIYEAKVKGKNSPIKAWSDKNIILKTALNRLQYMGSCRPKDIIQGFNVAKIAPKVSIFDSKLAENLVKEYLNSYNEIFDPFSGFSGRMIGAANMNKTYIGQDINNQHVLEAKEIIEYKGLKNCSVRCQDIFTDVNASYECLFTCSPYSDKEVWNDTDANKTCDEWIDICLNKYHCKKYLFVVDKTEKYSEYIVKTLSTQSHFGTHNEYVVLI